MQTSKLDDSIVVFQHLQYVHPWVTLRVWYALLWILPIWDDRLMEIAGKSYACLRGDLEGKGLN